MLKLVGTKTLFDGTGAEPTPDAHILISDGRVKDIGPRSKFTHLPDDTERIDLSGYHILPGLINAHTHLTIVPGDGNQPAQKRLPPAYNVLRSTPNVIKEIRSGVTTMRIMGEEAGIDIDFKNAVNRGLIHAPRMIVSAIGLSASHSHGASTRPTDGVHEVRKQVRQNLALGADFIKLFATGGASSPNKSLHSCPFTKAEISVAVEEAKRAETYVAAHAHGGLGLDYCIEQGVRSIEHGLFISEAQLEQIVKKNLWVVGTLAIFFHPTGIEQSDFKVPAIKDKVLRAREIAAETFGRIIKSGCNLALGTDSMHGLMHFEMEKLVEFGATPTQALLCSTKEAAKVCRAEDDVGTLEVGKYADFIAVEGDPTKDIKHLARVSAVYKEGRLFQGI